MQMAINRKDELKSVFEDTINQIQNHTFLHDATNESIKGTHYYATNDYPLIVKKEAAKSEIFVTRHTTFNAARELHKAYPDKKIAVLNFASATNPGGGVTHGSSAQEESLCRCSTLYPTLTQSAMWKQYYFVNRTDKNVLHTDACIYSPNVIIFKDDSYIPKMLPTKEWVSVDVISCAAPNLRNIVSNVYNPESGEAVHISPNELHLLHKRRAKHILTIAAANKVDMLVLGAFGCGAFANNARIVSDATFEALEEFIEYFDVIEFAIYCRKHETENFDAFLQTYERIN